MPRKLNAKGSKEAKRIDNIEKKTETDSGQVLFLEEISPRTRMILASMLEDALYELCTTWHLKC